MSDHLRDLSALLAGVVREPSEGLVWSVLADWLEEYDDPRRAELMRLHRNLVATCCEPDLHPERHAWQARVVKLLAEGVIPCVPRETVRIDESVTMEFAFVPPGSFLMGSPASEAKRDDDEVRHRVTLTKGFYLGIHPVTQAQWKAVMGTAPSRFKGDTLPVENIPWDDSSQFCQKLSQKTGKRFRLPTEAEWEYACRAGTTTPFWWGDTISTDQANYDGNYAFGNGEKGVYRQTTTPVGTFPANAWKLHDTHGNVWEWCSDWYGPLDGSDITDPRGPQSGESRVLRGGSWYDDPRHCRAAYRSWNEPAERRDVFGCRVLLCLD